MFYLVLWCARAIVGDNNILTGVRVTYYHPLLRYRPKARARSLVRAVFVQQLI